MAGYVQVEIGPVLSQLSMERPLRGARPLFFLTGYVDGLVDVQRDSPAPGLCLGWNGYTCGEKNWKDHKPKNC